MSNQVNKKDGLKVPTETINDLAQVLRAFAHPKRLQIVDSLIKEQKELITLLDETKISKTALVNHLTTLIDKELVFRVERGSYQITADGQQLFEAILNSYIRSKRQERIRRQQLFEDYSRRYSEVNEIDQDTLILDIEARYFPGWISFVCAITGVLNALDISCDTIDVGGYTGYAFLVNVTRGVTSPAGPTAHKAWKEFLKGIESFEWKLTLIEDSGSYPEGDSLTPEDLTRAKLFFKRVQKGLSKTKRPVVMWGFAAPEWGIVNGFTKDSYEASTFRHLNQKSEPPIHYYDLKAPGFMKAYFFEKQVPLIKTNQRDREALKRGIQMAEGTYAGQGCTSGSEAFEEWANVLDGIDVQVVLYHGNSYLGSCTNEGLIMAEGFLRRLQEKYHDKPQEKFLKQASKEYDRAQKIMEEFTKLFPFALIGDISSKDRKKGAAILRSVKPHLDSALEYMQKALQEWK